MEYRHIRGNRPPGSELSGPDWRGKGDLSRFVDRAVRQAIFWETVETIWERNKHLSTEEIQALADEAVDSIRKSHS